MAPAKYSSETERMVEFRAVEVRFVVREKVMSIDAEGTGVTVMEEVVEEEGRGRVSWIVSGERDWTSIVLGRFACLLI